MTTTELLEALLYLVRRIMLLEQALDAKERELEQLRSKEDELEPSE